MLLLSLAAICFAQDPLPQAVIQDTLAAPVRISAAGKPIDTGEDVGHSAPLVRDLNGDGRLDLLLGNFKGTVDLFAAGPGSDPDPVLLAPQRLEANGEPLEIPNW